ncbi:MAG TPA: rod shape-determining protein MreC [Clostridia bacterium]|nr:rod shape-determining protein MreC [Clostridia bacterium]
MRDFFRSVWFKIFAVIALILFGLMLRTGMSGGFASIPANVMGFVLTPLQKVSAQVSGAFSGAVSTVASYGSVKKENEQLKKEVSSLNSKLVDYNQMKNENSQYKEYLGIRDDNQDFKWEPAMVIARDPGQWFSVFTIDKGSLNGIGVNDPVITSDGLVGKVTQVMSTSSIVTTILDPSVSVGALVSQTNDPCITQGDKELGAKGRMKVSYLAKESTAAQGDIVITSGIGGIFPKKLKIGIVEEIRTETSGLSLYAVVKPMVDPSTVKNVFVITSFQGKAGDATKSSSSQSGGK